jgi:ACR3 family arsenite efflux pump ArsB
MLKREVLERWQVVVYAIAIGAGAAMGLARSDFGAWISPALWPLLALLLLVTFLQVPLADMGAALKQRRYIAALLVGNFVAVPAVVWGLSLLLPDDSSLRLGFFLVMLVPCTDWFTTFTHLGRGDGRLALVSTPLLLLTQMLLLPLFLWALLGREATAGMRAGPFLQAFAAIILLPLGIAVALERLARNRSRLAGALVKSAWLPVPLLGLVVFLITAAEIQGVLGAAGKLIRTVAAFALYFVAVPFIALGLGRMLRLAVPQTRTLVFSLGTRNSFVVLPLVLAWPGAGPVAASVIVLQAFVELCGMLAYIALLPRWPKQEPA